MTVHGKKFDEHVALILRELELAQSEAQEAADPTKGTSGWRFPIPCIIIFCRI